MSDVINDYKSNHTSQPLWNIRISVFFINKRANFFADIMLSNIVEVFMHFWTELQGVKRVTVRGDITVFRSTFKFDNFYFNYHIEANQVSSFLRFLASNSTPPVYTSPYPLMCTWADIDILGYSMTFILVHKDCPPPTTASIYLNRSTCPYTSDLAVLTWHLSFLSHSHTGYITVGTNLSVLSHEPLTQTDCFKGWKS